MNDQDEWGHDPSVQSMRWIFKGMEMAHKKILNHLNLSPFDLRLRKIREKARISFDRAWASGLRQGMIERQEDAVSLYAYCLEQSLSSEGIKVPREALPKDERIARFVKKGI